MPRPLSNKGTGISNSSISPRASGVLRPPAAQSHARLRITYCGFRRPLRATLGVEAHFALWKRLFCLVPHSKEGSLYQVGGAKIWRIAETRYLSGTPKKTSEDWPSEWFYMEGVPLPDPVRRGLPKFNNAPLKKHQSWHPRSPKRKTMNKSFT